ncbi:hypothetical protein NC651_028271 [Populus alba x Populus x berolinensis]|nr:hypothetical protein NC651_028271 [Populus alba x Populus x berolinensis]
MGSRGVANMILSRASRMNAKLQSSLEASLLEIEDVSHQHAGHAAMKGNTAGETHFNVKIVSPKFDGLNLVKRHRLPGSKKLKKSKKAKESDGNSKKAKKKKKNVIAGSHSESDSMTDENGYEDLPNGENSSKEKTVDDNLRQFEKVAAEVGIDEGVTSACDFPKVTGNGNLSKKRKRAKRVELKQYENPESNGQEDAEAGTSTMAKSTEKSAKKVRFSMKNNLIWKPSTPLTTTKFENTAFCDP